MVGMQSSPSGMEGLRREIAKIWRQLDEMRGAAGIKSSVLRGDRIEFQDEDGNLFLVTGQFTTNEAGSDHTNNGLAIYDPTGDTIVRASHDVTEARNDVVFGEPAELLDNFDVHSDDVNVNAGAQFDVDATIVVIETGSGTHFGMQSDGDVILRASTGQTLFLGNGVGEITMHSAIETTVASDGDVNIAASGNVDIDPDGDLRFFIGSHAVPANLSISANVVGIVSSALKYKDDIEDIAVDVDELFAVSGKTFVDSREKANAAKAKTKATRYPGFIADEWAEHETLRPFVRFEKGEPEGFHYDRVPVLHHELLKAQHARIGDLETIAVAHERRIEVLKAESAALRARLDSIEARMPGKPETPGKK